MSLLKELYYGNLFPADFHITDLPRYRQALTELVEKETRLNSFLPSDMQEIFREFEEIQETLSSENAFRSFAEGVRLGCRLMIEVFPKEE